jgi:hypothetical protein
MVLNLCVIALSEEVVRLREERDQLARDHAQVEERIGKMVEELKARNLLEQ